MNYSKISKAICEKVVPSLSSASPFHAAIVALALASMSPAGYAAEVVRGGSTGQPADNSTHAGCKLVSVSDILTTDPNAQDPVQARRCYRPTSLTFEDTNLSLEAAKEEIVGSWRVYYACDGKRAPVDTDFSFFNGNNMGVLGSVFRADGTFERNNLGRWNRPAVAQPQGAKSVMESSSYTLSRISSGNFRIDFSRIFSPSKQRFVRVKETGEYIMVTEHEDSTVCGPNGNLQTIYVRVPIS